MSTLNAGGRSITDGLIFQLDGDLSVSYVKTPKQLSGCILWLDASDSSTLTTEGVGYVRYWSDKSTSGVVATGGGLTLANEPLLTSNALNGLSSIYFDGTDYFEIPNNSALQTQNEKTIFVVYKYTKVSNTNYGVLIHRGTGDSNEEIRLAVVNSADWIYFDIGVGSGPYIQPTGQAANIRDYAANIITATATRSAGSSTLKLYSNGKDMGGSTISPTATPSVGSFVTSIGKQIEGASNVNFFTGFISEVIVYNRCLSDTERKQIEQYLGSKWAIPLSLTTSVTNVRDLTSITTLNTIYPTTYPILQHPYKDVIEQNAQSDYISFNSNTTIKTLGAIPFTIEWAFAIIARPNNGTNYGIFDNGESYQVKGVVIRVDGASKRLYVRISRGGTPSYTDFYDTTVLTTGKYYHYIVSYDGATVRFYLNGSLTNAVAFDKGTTATDSLFYPTGTSQNLQGEILFYKIFNRALTTAETSYQYELEKNRIESMPQIVADNMHFWLDANYYSSYPNTGTIWYDLSNNAKNFTTYVNQTVTALSFTSTEPRYFTFNGTSNFASSNGVTLGTSATVSVWIKMTSTAQCGILGDCLQDRSFTGYDISNGKMRYWYEYNYPSTQTVTGTTSVNTGTWKHLTWVKTGTSLIMYIDGVQDFSATLLTNVTGFVNSVGTLWGPCNASPFYTSLFNGQMANIMCYSVALSAAQVLQNYNAQKYRFGK
jgi:hypothetical protein